jgi:pyruvate/2-oxoacid:ferredoxin oxidoreductase beta subunit
MVFEVFNGFTAGISLCDTLQSCPYDNSAPDRHFRFSMEKEEVGYWMVFRVFNDFNAGIEFCDTLRSCP